MGVCPTARTAELLAKVSGSDNVWSVYFAICKVSNFLGVLWLALSDSGRHTVAQPASPVQPRRRSSVIHALTVAPERPVRTYKTLGLVAAR